MEDRKKISVQEVADIVIGSADRRARTTYVPEKTAVLSGVVNTLAFLTPDLKRKILNKMQGRPKL